MNRFQLTLQIIGRMVNWGMLLGPVIALITSLVLFQLNLSIFIIYAALFGLLYGVFVGGLCGIVFIGVLLMPLPKHVLKVRQQVTIGASGATALALSLLLLPVVMTTYAATPQPPVTPISMIGSIATSLAVVYASTRVMNWYNQPSPMLNQHEKHS